MPLKFIIFNKRYIGPEVGSHYYNAELQSICIFRTAHALYNHNVDETHDSLSHVIFNGIILIDFKIRNIV